MPQRFRTVRQEPGASVARMGQFHETIHVASIPRRGVRRSVRALVDTGSEYSWLPADVLTELGIERECTMEFITADGRRMVRDGGSAFMWAAGSETVDTVVFATASDHILLGAHTLEGMNLNVDPIAKRLIPGGPLPAPANFVVSRHP